MSDAYWIIEYKFAWLPAFIRVRVPGFGVVGGQWVWLRRYTRVLFWSPRLGRYRTYMTVLGHPERKEPSWDKQEGSRT